MPSIRITLDDVCLATIRCDGYDVVSVRLHGTQVEAELARLGVSAGRYPEKGESTYLTWVDEITIAANQRVSVSLVADGLTQPEGQALHERSSEEPEEEPAEVSSLQEVFQKIRLMEKRRLGWELRYCSSRGTAYTGSTLEDEHLFGFSALWNSSQPERLSISLSSNTLESIEKKDSGRDHARERLLVGEWATIEVLGELS